MCFNLWSTIFPEFIVLDLLVLFAADDLKGDNTAASSDTVQSVFHERYIFCHLQRPNGSFRAGHAGTWWAWAMDRCCSWLGSKIRRLLPMRWIPKTQCIPNSQWPSVFIYNTVTLHLYMSDSFGSAQWAIHQTIRITSSHWKIHWRLSTSFSHSVTRTIANPLEL